MLNGVNTYFYDKLIPRQPPERETGNKEYKRRLVHMKKHKRFRAEEFYEKRASQMLYRLLEGKGKAIYMIGIEDNGDLYPLKQKELDITLESMTKITEIIRTKIISIRIYGNNSIGFIATIRLKLNNDFLNTIENNLYLNIQV
jgi:GTPase